MDGSVVGIHAWTQGKVADASASGTSLPHMFCMDCERFDLLSSVLYSPDQIIIAEIRSDRKVQHNWNSSAGGGSVQSVHDGKSMFSELTKKLAEVQALVADDIEPS